MLWAYNKKLEITSCTILTAPAEEPMSRLHDRQPIILDPAVYDAWLDPATPPAEAKSLLTHDLDGQLQFYRVDRQVNSSKNKGGEELIKPIDMASEYGLLPL